jgi:hypothetical protein
MLFKSLQPILLAATSLLVLLQATSASATPQFARQTGWECSTCHFNFPELNDTGRQFKLMGYTMGNRQTLPVGGMLLASMSKTANYNGGYTSSDLPHDHELIAEQVSLLTGGKITDNIGAFVQVTYDGVAHHTSLDNTDLRFADSTTLNGKNLIYGVTLNNNPTVQDLFNTTPVWGFPYVGSPVANAPIASTRIDGGLGQTAGLGGYVDWNNNLYAELSFYHTADGAFSILHAGQLAADRVFLDGLNPYWRLAWHDSVGPHSWEFGAFGMSTKLFPDNTNPSGPTDHIRDMALDAQYQFVDGPHRYSLKTVWIHEKADWNSDPTLADHSNTSDKLNTFRLSGSYFWDNKIGGSAGVFSTTGTTDALHFVNDGSISGSLNGSPNSRGYVLGVDYLPMDRIKLGLQYTGYTKFNGAASNYDGNGRNARDNNTLYLTGWFLF